MSIKIIQEIHDSYDSSVEVLLKEAKTILENSSKRDAELSQRLTSLGFFNSKKAVAGKKVADEMNAALKLSHLISKYQQKYPFYKFITMDMVKKINEKYGLVCVPSHLYTGDIPIKNIEEIERFRCDEVDKTFSIEIHIGKYDTTTNFLSKKECDKIQNDLIDGSVLVTEEPFYISCPPSDAQLGREYRISGTFAVKMEKIEDPIVLKPVVGGFLIVSKWGLEGNDESLVNEKLN